jgi:hypothetical protein
MRVDGRVIEIDVTDTDRLRGYILYKILINMCILLVGISCSGHKIADLPAIKPDSEFFPPTGIGPYEYTIIKDSIFPSYMANVAELIFRIPSSPAHPPFPTIIIEPGFFSQSTDLEDVENRYATHGFLVVGVSNTSHYDLITTTLEPYRLALLETIRYAVECSKDSESALFTMIDTAAIGVTGHSMGGGGTIMACNSATDEYHYYIKAAIAMNPFGKCGGVNVKIPALIIASEFDSVTNPFMPGVSSSPEDIFFSFQSIPENTVKLFAVFKGMDYNAVVDQSTLLKTSGNAAVFLPTMVAWFKVYLNDDSDYNRYLDTASNEFSVLKARFAPKGSVPAYLYVK